MDYEEQDPFIEGCEKLMEAIDAFREAGLSNEAILAELKARL